ncbi:MAG: hypothetical protein WCS01_11195, partial [bacterium]
YARASVTRKQPGTPGTQPDHPCYLASARNMMVNVGLTENMKKFILNNMIVAATFLVGMLMLDFIHVHSGYRLKDPAYFVVPLALLLASFCYANRGLLDDKSPIARYSAIGLLSLASTIIWWFLSFWATLMFHRAIGGEF